MTGAEPGLPATMRAAYARTRGGPEAITVGALPIPTPGPGEVLVQVAASPVNHVDRLVLSGDYDTAWADPMVIGRDAVGTVAAAAPGTGFAEGEQVWTASMGYDGRTGTAAQYVAVPAARLYRLPRGIDPITAAATIHPAMTAWLGLVREGAIAAGQTVVIEGAGGAVGSAALQLAVAAGADTVVTCSAADTDWCARLGAHAVIDYRAPDLAARLAAAVPGGADLWWDQSGRNDFALSVPRLRRGGRIIVSAGLVGAAPALPVGALYTRDGSVRGFATSAAPVEDLAAAAGAVTGLWEAGRLRVRPPQVRDLAEAADAHRAMAGGVKRRQVLVP